jgi:hypothetical protein
VPLAKKTEVEEENILQISPVKLHAENSLSLNGDYQ